MKKASKTYKVLYVDKSEAISRPGPIFNNQMSADDYVKKISEESPNFHYWAEQMPELKAPVEEGVTITRTTFEELRTAHK